MSINLVFMQMPVVGELAGAMQAQPQVQQAIARQQAQETLKLEQGQVPEVEKQDETKSVNPDGHQGSEADPRRRRRRKPRDPEQQEQTLEASENPWAGNIVNKRV